VAYLLEKTRGLDACALRAADGGAADGRPGMVLGLGYIFFFVEAGNPLHFLYGTMAILVLNTVVHYYTSSHLTR
jgi:iron(III) transport system permease protein